MNFFQDKISIRGSILEVAKKIDDGLLTSEDNIPILNRTDIQKITHYLKKSTEISINLKETISKVSYDPTISLKDEYKKGHSGLTNISKFLKRQSSLDLSNVVKKSSSLPQSPLKKSFNKRQSDLLTNFTKKISSQTAPHSRGHQTPEIDELLPSPINETFLNTPVSGFSSPKTSNRRQNSYEETPLEQFSSSDDQFYSPDNSVTAKKNLFEVIKKLNLKNYSAIHFHNSRAKDVVNKNFSKIKGTSSIPTDTFKTYIKPFLRSFYRSDIDFIQVQALDLETQILPKFEANSINCKKQKSISKKHFEQFRELTRLETPPFDSFEDRLAIRLLADLQKELNAFTTDVINIDEDVIVDESSSDETEEKDLNNFYPTNCFESRVINELACANEMPEITSQAQPSQIALDLLQKQSQIKELNTYNNLKRNALRKSFSDHIAYQCYLHTLEDIDRKLEKAFIKRLPSRRNRFKKPPTKNISIEVKELIENRRFFIEKVGDVFNPGNLLLPTTSIYENIPCPRILIPDIFPGKQNK